MSACSINNHCYAVFAILDVLTVFAVLVVARIIIFAIGIIFAVFRILVFPFTDSFLYYHLIDICKDLRRKTFMKMHHGRWLKRRFAIVKTGISA